MFGPHLVFGVLLFALAACASWPLAFWSLPLTAGYMLAPLFALGAASPRLGRLFVQWRLCAAPEEAAPSALLRALTPAQGLSPATAGEIAVEQDFAVP